MQDNFFVSWRMCYGVVTMLCVIGCSGWYLVDIGLVCMVNYECDMWMIGIKWSVLCLGLDEMNWICQHFGGNCDLLLWFCCGFGLCWLKWLYLFNSCTNATAWCLIVCTTASNVLFIVAFTWSFVQEQRLNWSPLANHFLLLLRSN